MAFAKEGATVIVADVQVSRGEELVGRIQSEDGKAFFIKCDVSIESDVKNMITKTVEKFGRLDCAFNNAGIEGEQEGTNPDVDFAIVTTPTWYDSSSTFYFQVSRG